MSNIKKLSQKMEVEWDVFDNYHAILEWSLTVPYISHMIDNELDQDDQSHREDNDTFERKFISDCYALLCLDKLR